MHEIMLIKKRPGLKHLVGRFPSPRSFSLHRALAALLPFRDNAEPSIARGAACCSAVLWKLEMISSSRLGLACKKPAPGTMNVPCKVSYTFQLRERMMPCYLRTCVGGINRRCTVLPLGAGWYV